MTPSTGPRTAQGKAASSQNSLKHGLTATQLLLPGESAEELAALRTGLVRQYLPVGPLETAVLDEIAAGLWRLQRARRYETKLLDDYGPALFLTDRAPGFDRFLRYLGTIERHFQRAVNQLRNLQNDRRKSTKSTTSQPEQFVSSQPETHASLANAMTGLAPNFSSAAIEGTGYSDLRR